MEEKASELDLEGCMPFKQGELKEKTFQEEN